MKDLMTPEEKSKRRAKWIMFLLLIPTIGLAYMAISGRSNTNPKAAKDGTYVSFNTQVPGPAIERKDTVMNKMDYYEKATKDSLKKAEFIKRQQFGDAARLLSETLQRESLAEIETPVDEEAGSKADELLARLEVMKRDLSNPDKARTTPRRQKKPEPARDTTTISIKTQQRSIPDPELDRLDSIIDKVAILRRPAIPETIQSNNVAKAINAIAASNQFLYDGGTMAIRLKDEILVSGYSLHPENIVYGKASINADRVSVHISSIRIGQNILPVTWMVYDLDGQPGIRVQDRLTRQVAAQSADDGLGMMNLGYDPGITGQAANIGVQAMRSLLRKKVKAIRIPIKGGYPLLIRDMKGVTKIASQDSISKPNIEEPDSSEMIPFLHKSTKEGNIKLTLTGLYLQNGLLWLKLNCHNASISTFEPANIQCMVKPKPRLGRSTATETPIEIEYRRLPSKIDCNHDEDLLIAINPPAMPKRSSIVLNLTDKNGGPDLILSVKKKWMNKIQ